MHLRARRTKCRRSCCCGALSAKATRQRRWQCTVHHKAGAVLMASPSMRFEPARRVRQIRDSAASLCSLRQTLPAADGGAMRIAQRVDALERSEKIGDGEPEVGRAEQMLALRNRRLSLTPAERAAERCSKVAADIEALSQPDAPPGTSERLAQVMRRRRARRHLIERHGPARKDRRHRDRREAFNIMPSMPRGTDPASVQWATREFARAELADHKYVMVLHDHQANPHVHISVRA